MSDDFTLKVAGMNYLGWTSQRVTRSIEQLAHSFQFEASDPWVDQNKAVPIRAGDSCTIVQGSDLLTSGYIFEPNTDYDATNRSMSFGGRSKTGDLVDCAAIYGPGSWESRSLLDIAKDLCAPFGISVSSNVGDLGDPFSRSTFALNPGETVFQCLDRAAKQRGVMLLTEPDGNMTLDRAGSMKVQTVLEYGKNIKAGNKRVSWQDRFSAYTIKAQTKGDDNLFGSSTSLKRTSNDAGVTRYRPIIIAAENEDSGTELQKRADWERNVRAGRSARLTYTVEGWRHSTGLWEPNFLVRVKDPVLEIDQELLIVETTQTRSDQGTITTLVLTAKEAFDVQPLPPKTKKGLLD